MPPTSSKLFDPTSEPDDMDTQTFTGSSVMHKKIVMSFTIYCMHYISPFNSIIFVIYICICIHNSFQWEHVGVFSSYLVGFGAVCMIGICTFLKKNYWSTNWTEMYWFIATFHDGFFPHLIHSKNYKLHKPYLQSFFNNLYKSSLSILLPILTCITFENCR